MAAAIVCFVFLIPAATSQTTDTQSIRAALTAALRNTSAAGVVIDFETGHTLAETGSATLPSAPGSILKPLFLNAALEQHLIQPNTQVFCRRTLTIQDGGHPWQVNCTHPQTGTPFAATDALAYSCNRYFADLADRIAPTQVPVILEHYGIPGVHPPATREQKELLVLGLAGVAVSPEQMALAYRKLALAWQQPVKDGLRESVGYGMAHNAAVDGMEIAGKTGTTHAGWFAGIGQGLVVVVHLPRGNGADAAHLARQFFLGLRPQEVYAPTSESAPIADHAQTIRVGVFTTANVKRLTASPLVLEWKPDGIHTGKGVVKQLSLSGMRHLEANGHLEATAAGKWDIRWRRDGIQTVLTLPSEDYVAAALNGEAAPDEPVESLKALAVLIRTFAVVNATRHHAEGFSLCDSTHCQVVRLGAVRPAVAQAIHETAGETLWFGGHQAHVYFTEHCGGVREAAADVWPAEHARYLQGQQADPYCVRRSSAAWQAHIPLARLGPLLRAEGWKVPLPVEGIGIASRTESGRARLLKISGRGAPATISASSFRFAVNRTLGWSQVRSNWYTAAVSNGELVLDGKGYGHGAGLCQAGSYEMAVEGRSEQDILSFYFPGAVARISATRGGWQKSAGSGWTLLSTDPNSALLSQGNAAWAKAQALFGTAGANLHPVVQELPTTELFRQTTGEPGWVLGSTRGSDVFLQPAAVRQAHGGSEDLLLHEFLHVLVEHESSERAPLWLREGIVETLASGRHEGEGPVAGVDLTALDADLRHPATALASQRAHAVAARMASVLCNRYGVATVRGFLRTGVTAEALRSLQPGKSISARRSAAFDS